MKQARECNLIAQHSLRQPKILGAENSTRRQY